MSKKFAILPIIAAMLVCACGDDVTKVYESNTITVSTLDDAENCNGDQVGATVYSVEDEALFVCNGETWVSMRGAEGGSGEQGPQGPKGDSGVAGSSCTIAEIDSGFAVTCNGKTDTLRNGAPGESGRSCSGKVIENIGVEISCGDSVVDTVKNAVGLCGTQLYDPAIQFCDERDEQVYRYVKIGDQVWMAQNLNLGTMIPAADTSAAWTSTNAPATHYNTKKYCIGDSVENCAIYGGQYQWQAALRKTGWGNEAAISQGICPLGWHMPTRSEWSALRRYINAASPDTATSEKIKAMKSRTHWPEGKEGNDYFGWSAIPFFA